MVFGFFKGTRVGKSSCGSKMEKIKSDTVLKFEGRELTNLGFTQVIDLFEGE